MLTLPIIIKNFTAEEQQVGKNLTTMVTLLLTKTSFWNESKVTNEANGKSVIVEVTDRGPFSKVREIDLTKKAFMEITSNKNSGVVIVKLEVMEPKK
jgi:rare lipoprotein A